MSEGGYVPDWAVAFLYAIKAEREAVEQKVEELRHSTNLQIANFRDLRAEKEADFQKELRQEAARINNEIIALHDRITQLQQKHQQEVHERRMELTKLDSKLKALTDALRVITEEYNLVAMDLASLKKMALELDVRISEQKYKDFTTRPKSAVLEKVVEHSPAVPMRPTRPLPAAKWLAEQAREPIPKAASRSELLAAVQADRASALQEVFLRPDFGPLQSLVDISNQLASVNLDALASALMHLYEYYGRDYEALEAVVKKDIAQALDPTTALKSSSFASSMLAAYCKMHSREYLYSTIRQEVLKIIRENKSMEIDPQKLPPRETVEDNLILLKGAAQALLVEICNSVERLPMHVPYYSHHHNPFCSRAFSLRQIRRICFVIRREMTKKFPNDVPLAMANFLFARFLCSAIARPEDYNLDVPEIPDYARRALQLISEVFLAASRNTHFNLSYMVPMNPFVSNNLAFIRKFYQDAAKTSTNNVWPNSPTMSLEDVINELIRASATVPMNFMAQVDTQLSLVDKTKYTRIISYSGIERLNILVEALRISQLESSQPSPSEPNEYVGDLMSFLLHEDRALINTISNIVLAKQSTNFSLPIAKGLVTLFLFHDTSGLRVVEDLFKSAVKSEMTGATNTPEGRRKLFASLGSMIYRCLASFYGKEFLQKIFVPQLEAIRKGKAFSKLDKKGLQFISGILDSIVQNLNLCPLMLWKCNNYLARQPVPVATSYFILNYINAGLEQLDIFYTRMEPKDKEKIQKKVSKIMFALNKLALGEEVTKNEDKNYSDINVWIKNTGENFSRSFVSWSSTNQTSLPNPKAAPSWEDVRDAIKPLITFFRQEAAEFNAAFKQTYEQPLSFTIGQLTYASVILIRSRQ